MSNVSPIWICILSMSHLQEMIIGHALSTMMINCVLESAYYLTVSDNQSRQSSLIFLEDVLTPTGAS